MLTDADLKAMDDRAAAATSGPWYAHVGDDYSEHHPEDPEEGKRCNGICTFPEGGKPPETWTHSGEIVVTDLGYYPPRMTDARFIAAARTDVPALVAEVRRLKKEKDAMWEMIQGS